jgi:hypothetical protein
MGLTNRRRFEETSWGQRIEVLFEGGQGPEGAVAPHMDGNTNKMDVRVCNTHVLVR